jgi:hypothetical protein
MAAMYNNKGSLSLGVTSTGGVASTFEVGESLISFLFALEVIV